MPQTWKEKAVNMQHFYLKICRAPHLQLHHTPDPWAPIDENSKYQELLHDRGQSWRETLPGAASKKRHHRNAGEKETC